MKTGLIKTINQLVLTFFLVSLLACSDSEYTPQGVDKQKSAKKSEASSKAISPAKGAAASAYKMTDTFNVGETVFVRSLAVDAKQNTMWIGTTVGALEVDLTSKELRNTYTRENGFANEYIFSIMADSKGGTWFGTNGGGVSYLKDNNWKTWFPMHGLADYWVYSFTEQANGTIWIGTWYGLNTFNPKTSEFNTYLKELVNEWVYGLAVDSKDRVWIGTEGGVNMFDGTTWSTWTHKDGLGAANADGLPVSENTGLGTRSRHDLSVMLQGKETYNPNYTFALKVAADDSIWAGTWGGGASHFDGTSWTNYTVKDGLAGNIVYSIAMDENNNIWFGTNNGLSQFDGKDWYTFTRDDGLLDNGIYSVEVGPDGSVWVGSRAGVALLSRK